MIYKLLISIIIIFSIASCAAVKDEFGTTGGFASNYADKAFPAVTQQQHADRYLLSAMILAPIALETSQDAEQARATIGRVNALYNSLAELTYAVKACAIGNRNEGKACRTTQIEEKKGNGYAVETLSYDVQSDLYFLAKTLVVNLDLEVSASDLLDFNLSSLRKLVSRGTELFPIARRGAATYRDAVVLIADTVNSSCTDKEDRNCIILGEHLHNRYQKGVTSENLRDISDLLQKAKAAAKGKNWRMTKVQKESAIFHIDKACSYAFDFQKLGSDNNDAMVNCGFLRGGITSAARSKFKKAIAES